MQVERAKYHSLDSEVKRKKKVKRDYSETLANGADMAMNSSSGAATRHTPRIINEILIGIKSNGRSMKDKQGNTLTAQIEQKRRWMEHFSEVMNITFDPKNELEIPEPQQILYLPMDNISIHETETTEKL